MAAQVAKIVLVVYAVAFAFVGAYCLLWFFASSDLAFVSCNGQLASESPLNALRLSEFVSVSDDKSEPTAN